MDLVKPAAVGTHRLSIHIDGSYTAGRDHVGPALLELFRTTDFIGADIETYGLGVESRRIKSVAFGNDDTAVVLDPRDEKQAAMIRFGFQRARGIVFHNAPYDVPNLYLAGLLALDDINKVWDTLVYARLANPDELASRDLFNSGKTYLGLRGEDELIKAFKMLGYSKSDGYRIFDLDRPVYLQGAASDPMITARLFPAVRTAAYNRTTSGHPFTNHGVTGDEAWRLVDREQIVNRVLLRRSCKGLAVDLEYLDSYRDETSKERFAIEEELRSLGIDPGNGNHLARYLEDIGALPDDHPRTEKTQAPSTQAKHLELLTHPIAKRFVAQKRVAKIQDDYLQKIVDLSLNDRIHPVSQVLKAATGRMSMADPPLQQFSGPARGIVVADSDKWEDQLVSIDWSAIEPAITANISGETAVIEQYEQGIRIYTAISELAGVADKQAKVILLAGLYGEGVKKLALDLGITIDEARNLQDQIFSGIPRMNAFIRQMKDIARNHKLSFTISGRILPVPMGKYNGEWGVQSHKGVNFAVQGSAWDVLAETVVRAEEAGIADRILLLLHDEVVCTQDVAEEMRRIMETPPERLCFMAGRTPKLLTDSNLMGKRWQYV